MSKTFTLILVSCLVLFASQVVATNFLRVEFGGAVVTKDTLLYQEGHWEVSYSEEGFNAVVNVRINNVHSPSHPMITLKGKGSEIEPISYDHKGDSSSVSATFLIGPGVYLVQSTDSDGKQISWLKLKKIHISGKS